jgi:1-acyl-sn-glycerol-3-phosphate acyltransferase
MNKSSSNGKTRSVNIRQIFKEKNPRLAPYIPGFLYAYLDRMLHVDFINYFLKKHGGKYGIDFAAASIEEFNITKDVIGFERIPGRKNLIFASNHPLGGFDGMLLITLLGDKFPEIKVLVNDILTNIENMDEVFVPINKHGRQSIDAVRRIEDIFKSGVPVLTFPSGLVSRRKKGLIRDPEWKKNFISKAVQYERDVIPIHVSGRCTNFFYRLANLRKFLGIKANIEMFYLPDETYRHRNEKIRVIFGHPISWQTFDKRRNHAGWAKTVQDFVYALSDNPDLRFDRFI